MHVHNPHMYYMYYICTSYVQKDNSIPQYIHTYTFIRTHTCIDAPLRRRMGTCTSRIRTNRQFYIHTYIHTHTYMYRCSTTILQHTYIHTYTHTCIDAQLRRRMGTCTSRIRANRQFYTHTYIHTYTHTCIDAQLRRRMGTCTSRVRTNRQFHTPSDW